MTVLAMPRYRAATMMQLSYTVQMYASSQQRVGSYARPLLSASRSAQWRPFQHCLSGLNAYWAIPNFLRWLPSLVVSPFDSLLVNDGDFELPQGDRPTDKLLPISVGVAT